MSQQNIQEIFNRIKEKQSEVKDLRSMCKEVLENSSQYKQIEEEMKVLRVKRKQIKDSVLEECSSELIKIDGLTADISSDQEMLTDMAINQYIKGESIELKDKYDTTYEPVFVVKFKKSN